MLEGWEAGKLGCWEAKKAFRPSSFPAFQPNIKENKIHV
jgi:hypothetical protein